MYHDIPPDPSNPQRAAMARAVATCVHCGFCLPACPTYQVLGEEMDSPRGRIVLMKQVLEGTLAVDEAREHIDRCLGCLGCVTACPSGVRYDELLTPFRAEMVDNEGLGLDGLKRQALLDTLESPSTFRRAARLGHVAQRISALVPKPLKPMLTLLPETLPDAEPLPAFTPARGERRGRVALLAGCAQQVLSPGINHATIRVLAFNGFDVVVPPDQGCCGALALHVGEVDRAYDRATALARALPDDVDAIVTNAAGCGSAMQEYGHAFAGRAQEDRLASVGSRVRDVTTFLSEAGLVDVPASTTTLTVAYHDACHLAHAQGVRSAPRALLSRIPGLTLVDLPESELCCGSAGLYNVEQPAIAAALGTRKARHVAGTGATVVAAGNIGCLVQIATHLQALEAPVAVLHTTEVLDRAYAGTLPGIAPSNG